MKRLILRLAMRKRRKAALHTCFRSVNNQDAHGRHEQYYFPAGRNGAVPAELIASKILEVAVERNLFSPIARGGRNRRNANLSVASN